MAKKQLYVVMRGRVQGVFFRGQTKERAKELGITGWIRNNPDGTVEAMFEGEELVLERMLMWCRKGPDLAEVAQVQAKYLPNRNEFRDFKILY
jgi:acylphosphatase